MTVPTLPVKHEVEITLTCPADHVKKGGDKATCQDGQLVPTTTPLQCLSIGIGIIIFFHHHVHIISFRILFSYSFLYIVIFEFFTTTRITRITKFNVLLQL